MSDAVVKSATSDNSNAAPLTDEQEWRMDVHRHFRFAWWSLFVFVGIGIALEGLHGFKMPFYLNVGMENRRLMWTLGHASGTVLALFHGMFGLVIHFFPRETTGWRWLASPLLTGASTLIPGGFLLGGYFLYGGEPGLGLRFLVPIGFLLLLGSFFMMALAQSLSRK